MSGVDTLRETMTAFLREKGINAVTAWDGKERTYQTEPVVAVSLRSCQGEPAGFRDYLGERYDPTRDIWEELYGKRVTLRFGVDIYAPKHSGEEGCLTVFAGLAEAVAADGPEGLTVREVSCQETDYDAETGRFHCKAEAVCSAYIYATAVDNGTFADFMVKGTRQ